MPGKTIKNKSHIETGNFKNKNIPANFKSLMIIRSPTYRASYYPPYIGTDIAYLEKV